MLTQVAMKGKMGFRRTESEPANTTVNDIRCKFESTPDGYTAPEVGLAFGTKRSTPASTPTSDTSSPIVSRKLIADSIMQLKSPTQPKKSVAQTTDSKLDNGGIIGKTNRLTSPTQQTPMDKYKTAIVKPTSLIISNGNQTPNKQSVDKSSLIGLHNTGIVSTRKQQIGSPIISPTVAVTNTRAKKVLLDSSANDVTASQEKVKGSQEKQSSVVDKKIATASNNNNNSKDITRDNSYRYSFPENTTTKTATPRAQAGRQPAKAFWKSVSVESDTTNVDSAGSTSRVDSVMEPGMDYAKLKKDTGKERMSASKSNDKTNSSPKVTVKAVLLTASNLKKVSESLTDSKSSHRVGSLGEDGKSSLRTLSKSPSVSSTCSSMDSFDTEYINGSISHKYKRRDTKPPQNIVARRTQLFEKSMDEINAVLEEAEAYNKVRDGGFGTAFTTVTTPSTQAKSSKTLPSSTVSQMSTAQSKASIDKSIGLTNNNIKLADKNPQVSKSSRLTTDILHSTANTQEKEKSLPNTPSTAKLKSLSEDVGNAKLASPNAAFKPKTKAPPPKPPRTFEHPPLSASSSNEIAFDPVIIPRQAGDGEENHGYEHYMSNPSAHIYTSVTLPAESRTYTTTTSADTRPYTSLTTAGGSEGDDSIAGSENAYDTLGRVSVASSYEHYDTISQSELDSDVSRPPTLPRRPSNLRHRPLTTAFSHLDIGSKNAAFQHQLNKALSSTAQTIKETSPTSPSPTKSKSPFKLKYLLPKIRRKPDELRKASSMADLLDDKEGVYDPVEIRPRSKDHLRNVPNLSPPKVSIDEAGYALPDIKVCSPFYS